MPVIIGPVYLAIRSTHAIKITYNNICLCGFGLVDEFMDGFDVDEVVTIYKEYVFSFGHLDTQVGACTGTTKGGICEKDGYNTTVLQLGITDDHGGIVSAVIVDDDNFEVFVCLIHDAGKTLYQIRFHIVDSDYH